MIDKKDFLLFQPFLPTLSAFSLTIYQASSLPLSLDQAPAQSLFSSFPCNFRLDSNPSPLSTLDFQCMNVITELMIYMQKFLHSDWWRACQLILNSAKTCNKKTMADRFAESNNILIQSLKDNAKNKNPQQSTNNWINVWSALAGQQGHDKGIEGYEPVALNKIQPHKAK